MSSQPSGHGRDTTWETLLNALVQGGTSYLRTRQEAALRQATERREQRAAELAERQQAGREKSEERSAADALRRRDLEASELESKIQAELEARRERAAAADELRRRFPQELAGIADDETTLRVGRQLLVPLAPAVVPTPSGQYGVVPRTRGAGDTPSATPIPGSGREPTPDERTSAVEATDFAGLIDQLEAVDAGNPGASGLAGTATRFSRSPGVGPLVGSAVSAFGGPALQQAFTLQNQMLLSAARIYAGQAQTLSEIQSQINANTIQAGDGPANRRLKFNGLRKVAARMRADAGRAMPTAEPDAGALSVDDLERLLTGRN